jgi:tripartite-type tricarboxylate transporter receptor subunit TctC
VEHSRRNFVGMAASATLLPLTVSLGRAAAYPTRPIRLIVPFAAGGGTDIVARLTGQALAERLGQPFIIENKPGAGTNLGTETLVRSTADGYTLLLASPPNVINMTLYKSLSFDFVRQTTPIGSVVRGPLIMAVTPSLPVKSVQEFIAYSRERRGINMASAGIGSTSHLAGELFKMMSGIDLLHVPYRGTSPALVDLMSGQVQVMFVTSTGAIDYIKSSTLRALAVTSEARSAELPDTPTVGEALEGYEASTWYGFVAPSGTSPEIVAQLNESLNACLGEPKVRARLIQLGGSILSGSPEDFGKLILRETKKWGDVVKYAGASAG